MLEALRVQSIERDGSNDLEKVEGKEATQRPEEIDLIEQLRMKKIELEEKVEAVSQQAVENQRLLTQAEEALKEAKGTGADSVVSLWSEISTARAKLGDFEMLKKELISVDGEINELEERDVTALAKKMRVAIAGSFIMGKANKLLKQYQKTVLDKGEREKMIDEVQDKSYRRHPEGFVKGVALSQEKLLSLINPQWVKLAGKLEAQDRSGIENVKYRIVHELIDDGRIVAENEELSEEAVDFKDAESVLSALSNDKKKKFLQIIGEYFSTVQTEIDRLDHLMIRGEVVQDDVGLDVVRRNQRELGDLKQRATRDSEGLKKLFRLSGFD